MIRSAVIRRGLGATFAPLLAWLLAACVFQSYQPAPVDRDGMAAEHEAHDPGDEMIREFRRQRGAEPASWPPARWSFDDLVWLAWYGHPDLVAARSHARVGEAGIAVASRRLNPSLRFTPEHHRDRDPGQQPWGLSLDLDVPVVTADKRAIVREQAELGAQIAQIDVAQTAWQVRSRLRARYVDWVDAQRELGSFDDEVRLREEVTALMDRRVELGHAAVADALQDRLRLGEARIAQAQARARVVEARGQLAEASGISRERFDALELVAAWPGEQPIGVPVSVEPAGRVGPERVAAGPRFVATEPKIAWALLDPREMRRRVALNRLDIERALVTYAGGEAALRLEVARQYPDLTLRPGYHFEPADTVWAVGLAMLLPVLDRNEAGIAQAEARRQALADDVRALQARAIAGAQTAAARFRQAQDERDRAARQREITGSQLARVERRFERGQADRRELVLSRLDNLLATRRERIAMLGRERAIGQLEDAVQRPVNG